jgi:hypothetical protein
MDKMVDGIDLTEADFMPLKHAGCGAFNPVFKIEKSEEENRRVTFFLFDKDNLPKLPCSNTDLEPCRQQMHQADTDLTTFRYHKEFRCCYYDSLAKNCKGEITVPDIITYDAHMHFMSGHTTPLPLLRNQVPFKPRLRRRTIDAVGNLPQVFGVARGAKMGGRKTMDIAADGMDDNIAIYESFHGKPVDRNLMTPMVAMPMDMSYAHLDGYRGKPVYIKVKMREYYMREYQVRIEGESFTQFEKVLLWPKEVGEELKDLKDTRQYVIENNIVKPTEIDSEKFQADYKDKDGKLKQIKEGFYYYQDRKSEKEDIESKKDKVPRQAVTELISFLMTPDYFYNI